VELYKKKDSRCYWYDFKLRGRRYRSSTKEMNKKRAGKIAALRLSQAMGGIGPLDRKAPYLEEFSTRFLSWVESAALAGKSTKYYRNGWRLLSKTKIIGVRLDHITKDDVAGSVSTAHRFNNRGDGNATALCVITPGALGPQYFREQGELLAAGRRRPARQNNDGGDHETPRSRACCGSSKRDHPMKQVLKDLRSGSVGCLLVLN
jgi:hypothetical protein